MIKSVALWIPKAFALAVLTVLAWLLAYIFALFIVKAEESETTGFPSLFPGMPRDFLQSWCRIWQTQDAPVDELWYGDDYTGWPKKGKTQTDYDGSAWLRYICRVTWLQRNAAYGFGAKWGYDATGMTPITTNDNERFWRTGNNCFSYWSVINSKGDKAWCIRSQIYYWKPYCLEFYLGYKLHGDSIKGKKLVAIQPGLPRKYSEQ